jgi:hypothetical protein
MGPRISVTALPPRGRRSPRRYRSSVHLARFGPQQSWRVLRGAEAFLGSLRALQCVVVVGIALARCRFPEQRVQEHRRRVAGSCACLLGTQADL